MNILTVKPRRSPRASYPSRAWPTDPFLGMNSDIDRLFSHVWPSLWSNEAEVGADVLRPAVDVSETKTGLEVTVDLPGVKPEDMTVELEDNVLTLKAERVSVHDDEDKDRQVHLMERSVGTFMRRFSLPIEVDEDKVEASFTDGVLSITIPRAEAAKTAAKRIQIKR